MVLALVPLFLRLWPIGHGLPTTSYVPDTHVVRNALGMARDRDLVPPVGLYSTYPYLLSYLLLPVYAGEYAFGRLSGAWGGAAEFGTKLLEEPARAHLPARWLVALLAAAAPWVVFRAGRAMGLRAGAWVAAWLVATGLLHVQFSVQERPWAPMVTFLALAAWGAAVHARDGTRLPLHLSGLAAALALSTHQGGAPVIALTGLGWLLSPIGWRGAALRERLRTGALCVALFAVLALAVGHPYYLVHGLPDRSQVAAGGSLGDGALTLGGQAFVPTFRPATFAHLGPALLGYDPALVLLALAGLVGLLRVRAARPALVFALLWAAVFLFGEGEYVRYLLPLAVLLAWPAGWAAERLARRPAGRAALALLLLLPLVQALRLGVVLRREDTRSIAARRLAEEWPEARLAVDAHGPELPLDRASLERLAGWRDLGARERHRLAVLTAWQAVPPDERPGEPPGGWGLDAVPLEALLDLDERTRTSWVEPEEAAELPADTTALLRALDRTHLLVVDRAPDDGRPPLLLDDGPPPTDADGAPLPKLAAVRVEQPPLLVVHPAGAGGHCRDARLPTELDFPLTQLWRLERPGPALSLYRLPGEDR